MRTAQAVEAVRDLSTGLLEHVDQLVLAAELSVVYEAVRLHCEVRQPGEGGISWQGLNAQGCGLRVLITASCSSQTTPMVGHMP